MYVCMYVLYVLGGRVCMHAIGDVYEGSFAHDQRHGYGTYTYFSGDVYSGDWKVREQEEEQEEEEEDIFHNY
jgi:hypothetical protein